MLLCQRSKNNYSNYSILMMLNGRFILIFILQNVVTSTTITVIGGGVGGLVSSAHIANSLKGDAGIRIYFYHSYMQHLNLIVIQLL